MFVYNLDTNPQGVNGVTSSQCMHDNGDQGSNISLWNDITIPPKTAVPASGWSSPQYIEAKDSGACVSAESWFKISFANNASLKIELSESPQHPAEAMWDGNIVCSVGNYSFMGNPEFGVMILPTDFPDQNKYTAAPTPGPGVTYYNVYYETDNGTFFLLMDGTLRPIPDVPTLLNLCNSVITPANPSVFNSFPNIQSAPYPIGQQIMEGARLVNVPGNNLAIYLTDIMQSNPNQVVLRWIISPAQLMSYGFVGQVQEYTQTPIVYGPDITEGFSEYDVSRWMGYLNGKTNSQFFNQPLYMVSLPASHDSGMSAVNEHTIGANAKNTQTQILDIEGQLNAGIRYFDLRPSVWKINDNNSPGSFAFGHFGDFMGGQGCLGQNMIAALQQVNSFITNHTEEIVILKFSHYCDSDCKSFPLDLQTLMIETIQHYLPGLMYTAGYCQKINSYTIQSIISTGKRVICIFDNLDQSLYNPTAGILKFGDLSSLQLPPSPPTYPNVYYESDNGTFFLRMDGTLRPIPDVPTLLNLCNSVITPAEPAGFYSFPNIQSLPFPIGQPIMEGARLVNVPGNNIAIYLTDIMQSNPGQEVLRLIVSPAQLMSYGFVGNVQLYNQNPIVYGPEVSTLGSNFDIYDNYSNTDMLAVMAADQINKYTMFLSGNGNNFAQNGLFLLSYTLTETTLEAVSSFAGFGSILGLAANANKYLWVVITSILRGPGSQQPPNLIYLDAVDNSNAITAAIYLNLQNAIYQS